MIYFGGDVDELSRRRDRQIDRAAQPDAQPFREWPDGFTRQLESSRTEGRGHQRAVGRNVQKMPGCGVLGDDTTNKRAIDSRFQIEDRDVASGWLVTAFAGFELRVLSDPIERHLRNRQ